MANKYIIHGATYCGDGTASNEAASAGAAGAWNNINVFEGTAPAYGTLAAGDTVYIRSKASGDTAITVSKSVAVTLGSTSATQAAPITWVIDGGTIWSGINGTVTYTRSSSAAIVTITYHNNVIAENYEKFVIVNPTASPSWGDTLVKAYQTTLRNVLLDQSACTSSADTQMVDFSTVLNLDSCHLKFGNGSLNAGRSHFMAGGNNGAHKVTLTNCHIEYTYNGATGRVLLGPSGNYCGYYELIGGKITGYTSVQYLTRLDITGSAPYPVYIEGTQIPTNYNLNYVTGSASALSEGFIEAVAIDAAGVGGHWEKANGYITSRTDNNPPARNAFLPDSNSTPWSWRVYARYTNMFEIPVRLVLMKMYTGTAAAATIELEYLMSTAVTGANKKTVWMTVSYIDNTTGEAVGMTTRTVATDALDSSSVTDWSAEVWGMISFNKKKFSLTTPSSIKANTPITVTMNVGIGNSDTSAIYFVDPDFTVTV